ncbi:MAG: methyltransferase domain-containing protein [Pseudomonadota bacterium]
MAHAALKAAYPIETSADEFTRLNIQADLFRKDARAMLAGLGGGAGLRVLDLCCGIGGTTDVLSEWVGEGGSVVGADLDTAKLDEACSWAARQGLSNVTFVEADAFDTGFEPASFDLVHTRFALSVIENGLAMLDHILALTKPGGIVFLEEADTRSMLCEPSTADWVEARHIFRETFLAVGADTSLGSRLDEECRARGMSDLQIRLCRHDQTAADPMHFHVPLTLTAMRETIEERGLMKKTKLDALAARVTDHLASPGTKTTTFTMIQIAGRAPA